MAARGQTQARAQSKIRFREANRDTMPPIVAVGQHQAPFEDLYHYVLTRSWPAFFGLIAGAFLVANGVFAGVYHLLPGGVVNVKTLEDAFYFSVQTMATIGYGGMYPVSRLAHVLVTLEALCGIVGVALVTGVTFAKFARPRARVLFSDKAVVTPRNGAPYLMFRMANWRHNNIVEAQLRVILLMTERTPEGDTFRVPLELRLERDRSSVFVLSWTAMHRIDEASPFYGTEEAVRARLQQREAEIYLTLSGQDETFSQTIHARYRYTLDDLHWNVRFADVLTSGADGARTIDYRQFHEVLPVPGRPAVMAQREAG